jgi:amidase
MGVARPSPEQLIEVASSLGMTIDRSRALEFLEIMQGNFAAYDVVDALPDYVPAVKYPRVPGYQPVGEENRYNAWYYKTTIKGAPKGKLAGKTVALKDNVCLAGVPMMVGASSLRGYVPDVDATIVNRLLDAGATILGKAHCEYFCLSGASHTSAAGPVHNPLRMGYSSGGSSSGSAALVAAAEVDMSIGGDQGGSIRIPAAFCGIYGMKPTYGVIPYTGVMPIESTVDHIGPMTANVHDNALMLEVMAGEDGLDPRQNSPKIEPYTKALKRGVKGLRIGVVKEGFGLPTSEKDVDAKVRAAAKRFAKLGAEVKEVSIPDHAIGTAIWTPIALEGLQMQMMLGNSMGFNWKGLYTTSLLKAHSNWRQAADDLSPSLQMAMLTAQHFLNHYRGYFYAKAQNLARRLRATYDAAFAEHDLLLMPTVPMKATPIPPADASMKLYIQRALELLPNTAPFNATGHPSISAPCGMSDGLPVGMMLTARHYDESTIYAAAAAFEASEDWKKL